MVFITFYCFECCAILFPNGMSSHPDPQMTWLLLCNPVNVAVRPDLHIMSLGEADDVVCWGYCELLVWISGIPKGQQSAKFSDTWGTL